MLCPIARALDRVGDRWTLLVLRDLHAGPMRYGELQRGLAGLATNLLATRLEQLQRNGLITRDGNLYALTDDGRRTDRLLWELAQLGMSYPPDPDVKPPGHLRLVAVTLQSALRKVAPADLDVVAELVLDGESFAIRATDGDITVRYGAPDSPYVVARSSYEPLMLAAGGDTPLDEFATEHLSVEGDATAVAAFGALMTRVMTDGFAASPT